MLVAVENERHQGNQGDDCNHCVQNVKVDVVLAFALGAGDRRRSGFTARQRVGIWSPGGTIGRWDVQ